MRVRRADLSRVSALALRKRLNKAGGWLRVPWPVESSARPPLLAYDFSPLTETEGPDTRKFLGQFPVRRGNWLLTGRRYSTIAGSGWVVPADPAAQPGQPVISTSSKWPVRRRGRGFGVTETGRQTGLDGLRARPTGPGSCGPRPRHPQEGGGAPDRMGRNPQAEAARKGRRLLSSLRYVVVFPTFPGVYEPAGTGN